MLTKINQKISAARDDALAPSRELIENINIRSDEINDELDRMHKFDPFTAISSGDLETAEATIANNNQKIDELNNLSELYLQAVIKYKQEQAKTGNHFQELSGRLSTLLTAVINSKQSILAHRALHGVNGPHLEQAALTANYNALKQLLDKAAEDFDCANEVAELYEYIDVVDLPQTMSEVA